MNDRELRTLARHGLFIRQRVYKTGQEDRTSQRCGDSEDRFAANFDVIHWQRRWRRRIRGAGTAQTLWFRPNQGDKCSLNNAVTAVADRTWSKLPNANSMT